MAELINTVQIDEEERPLELEDINTLASMPWREYLRRANYNKDPDLMCQMCIADQKKKHGRQVIKCQGYKHYKETLKEQYGEVLDVIEQEFDQEELDVLNAPYDPVSWFRMHSKRKDMIETRFYQEMILRCSAKNMSIRAGRRCVARGALVTLADNSTKRIEDMTVGDRVVSYYNGKLVTSRVSDVIDNGFRDVYEITFKDGKQITVTDDHEVLSTEGWKTLRDGLKDAVVVNNTNTDISKVLQVVHKGIVQVYDISVEDTHNFVANGVVVHNCGKTFSIAMKVLHKIAVATQPIEILVGAPMITHIDEIVETLETLIHNLDIPNFLVKKKSQPILHMTFFNGSILKGVSASSDGTSFRGKSADLVWLDEVDFIPVKALEAIKGIMLDNPNVELVYTSTPIGEGNLFKFSQQPSTKEFHYPSFARPDYDDDMHSTISDMSDVAYAQEVLGLYGVDSDGVFPIPLLDKAEEYYDMTAYSVDFVLGNRERFIIFIGVDWNHDNNGTRIIVVGYDKLNDKFFKVDGYNIAKLKMTQALAVDKVVEVNRIYNADHILCDEGFGTAQISMLRLRGEEQYGKVPIGHPDLKLVDTVAVSFGASLPIIDPVTSQTLKRNTKQFIVETAQKVLEDGRLALHSNRDNDLIMQMKNYHVANRGSRGNIYKPKNKKIGDHDLDAFMLGVYGFTMFYSDFIKPQDLGYGSVISTYDTRYVAEDREISSFTTGRFKSHRAGVRRAKRRTF